MYKDNPYLHFHSSIQFNLNNLAFICCLPFWKCLGMTFLMCMIKSFLIKTCSISSTTQCTGHQTQQNFATFVFSNVYRMMMCLSICLIIAVAVERYLAVCRPHHFREVQGRSNRVVMYILPAFLVAVAINVTKFFEIEVVEYCVDYAHCGCGVISGYISF